MPIVHDPHSGQFMPGAHAHKNGEGSDAGGGSAGDNPAFKAHESKVAHAASKEAHEHPSKDTHLAAAKAHSAAAFHHSNAAFDAKGSAVGHHEAAQEHHQEKAAAHFAEAKKLSGPQKATMESTYRKWESHLDAAEKKAVFDYTDSSREMNSRLRSDPSFRNDTVHNLDRALNKGATHEDMTVFRTVGPGVLSQLREGSVFKDNAYVSTTTQQHILTDLHKTLGAGEANMYITVPKGSKGALITNLSAFKAEHEFLLPRGSAFRVDSIHRVEGGPAIVALTLLND